MEREVEEARELVRDLLEIDHARPRTRAECEECAVCQAARDGELAIDDDLELACGHRGDQIIHHSRPCVLVGCRHASYLDVTEAGSILLLHADVEPEEMPPDRSCTLDVAESGDRTLDVVGTANGVSRERARQVEVIARRNLRAGLLARGISEEDLDGFFHAEGFVEPTSE